jgi:thiamine-monophosphate kinase
LNEFDVIRRLARSVPGSGSGLRLGIGDDAAVLAPPAGKDLVVALDTLIAGTHFDIRLPPEAIGHRALAVNLSDLAAMGAEPRWFLLSLSMQSDDEVWLDGFAAGLSALARAHDVALIGGDTVRGPLSVSITALGYVPEGTALTRDGAQPGDTLFVTGALGAAGHAWRALADGAACDASLPGLNALARPQARVGIGQQLRGLATAAIDLSDGLRVDLERLLAASGLAAQVDVAQLPVAQEILDACDRARALELALDGGDDYELLFTVSPGSLARIDELARSWPCRVTRIGLCENGQGARWLQHGSEVSLPRTEFRHF